MLSNMSPKKSLISQSKAVACAVLVSLLLSGCNTLATKHTLYEGEVANAATIRSFDTVLVEYVDNKSMGMNFVGQEKEYSVLPGVHTVIVEYADFWSPSSGEDEKVTSAPVKITFNTEPNQTYQILHDRVASLENSKNFAEKPVFFVKNITSGKIIDANFELAAPKSFIPTIKFASTPDYQFVSDGPAVEAGAVTKATVNAGAKTVTDSAQVSQSEQLIQESVQTSSSPASALHNMQQLWEGATKEEKAAFLQWITVK